MKGDPLAEVKRVTLAVAGFGPLCRQAGSWFQIGCEVDEGLEHSGGQWADRTRASRCGVEGVWRRTPTNGEGTTLATCGRPPRTASAAARGNKSRQRDDCDEGNLASVKCGNHCFSYTRMDVDVTIDALSIGAGRRQFRLR